ncbi:MAG: hypothetical protein OJI67_11595 [Prosthecobacter sp.]|nr:hypothetical protein [Prosthecobacter sp.]
MTNQDDLFPLPAGFKPDGQRTEPLLWVKELRIYKVLSPGPNDLLRKVELHPGLNILWAKPRDRSDPTKRSSQGVSGHATGKTTFCRFIRYLLGESTFGNEDQRGRLREVFPEGWVVGEVHLDGIPWLVCRPFRVGGTPHVAYRGQTMDSLFMMDGGSEPFDEYRKELTRLLAEPLPVTTFATSPTPIEWAHLIQWLTRDQECRYAGIAELRHTSSDSKSPHMMAEDTHFLFRAVLGLIDPAEQAELEINKALLKTKQEAERLAPLLRYRGDTSCQRLREKLPDFRQDLEGANFLEAVQRYYDDRANSFEKELKLIEEPVSLKAARKNLYENERDLLAAQERMGEIAKNIEWIDQQIRQLKGDISKSDLDEWVQANMAAEHECGRSLAEAIEWECPLAIGRKLPSHGRPQTVPTAPLARDLETRKELEGERLKKNAVVVSEQKNRVAVAAETLNNENQAYDLFRANMATQKAEDEAVAAEAGRAFNDKSEADKLDEDLKDLEGKIRKSQDSQGEIREKRSGALSAFSDTFGRIMREIMNEEVRGFVRFQGRKIKPVLKKEEIELTSAALETLKFICFDLAALISGVEGRGGHPRFLIHDGPREADLDADLYREIFRMVRSLEESFGERPLSFQYIITTTEAPPDNLKHDQWLLSPVLDATTLTGKLLGGNF